MSVMRCWAAASIFLLAGCSSEENAGTPSSSTDAGNTNDAPNDVATIDSGDAGTQPDDLSSVLEPFQSASGLPALGAAVWHGDQLVALGVTGTRKLGDPTLATTNDRWHLGSDTKAMTATLIGIYVDRGDIHFDDTIGQLFAGETIDPGYSAVTIEQLLQHRGGAPGTMPADIWSAMWAAGTSPTARIEAVKSLISRPLEQAIGTYVYSNAGYMIAGAALERVEQSKPWEELLQEDVFAPLGMTSCGFGAPGTPDSVDEPWGHDVLDPKNPGPLADNPPSLGPAGTVHCSLVDWGKFLAVHLHGARNESVALVSQATLEKIQTPPVGADYALGWGVVDQTWAGGTTLTHSGSNSLWFATAWIAPLKNTTLAVVTNRGDDVAAGAVDQAFGPLIETYVK